VSVLLGIPNLSEGRDRAAIDELAGAAAAEPAVRVLDVHSDPDHHRTVYTLAGEPGRIAPAVTALAERAIELIDLGDHDGAHPRVGAIDVAPVVYLDPADRGSACAEALVQADMLSERLGIAVFLYGELAGGRTRAELRRGGPERLAERIAAGDLRPDFGPRRLHPRAGAVLVGARPPLVAFNVELAPPATLKDAKRIAQTIRESGPEGLPGLRAIGLWLDRRGVAQVSTNVEDHLATRLADVVQAVARHASVSEAELVGLAPRAAFDDFPEGVPLRNRRVLEDALAGTT
jgi:glutamate formiminotransferase/glutamate formiminotransferase/formiminotetrahydrofolate cyclodeaminase